MYGSKNILFLLPLFEKRKSHTFSIFSYPGSTKVLTSAKIRIPSQKCCRHFHLMQDCLKYLCAQFGSDSTKNKEMVKGGGGREWSNALPSCYPTYLTSKKPNSCRVKQLGSLKIFKLEIKKWILFECPCRFCQTYIQQVGFV